MLSVLIRLLELKKKTKHVTAKSSEIDRRHLLDHEPNCRLQDVCTNLDLDSISAFEALDACAEHEICSQDLQTRADGEDMQSNVW